MRVFPIAALIAVAGSAVADSELDKIRDRKAAAVQRYAAARDLAARLASVPELSSVASMAVISDDVPIRAPLLAALVSAGLLSEATAKLVPTHTQVARKLGELLRDDERGKLDADDCWIEPGDARAIRVRCRHSQCAHACVHVTTDATFAVGATWKLVDHGERRSDDGVCGCCM
jgi:hypothetical protein